MKTLLTIVAVFLISSLSFGQNVSSYLQDISVTVKAGGAEGSGVIFTREIEGKKVNFIWTAGHVVSRLKNTRSAVDPVTGTTRSIVEFTDAAVVQELREDGRRVGEVKFDAKVVKYSDADYGEDLALLQIRKVGFSGSSAKFLLDNNILDLGTELLHVGSLLGQDGANSMTTGIMSQIGRVYQSKVYDQTTVTAFPGSSGGGVFNKEGQYVGMLVRGAGETFNLIVPIRRIKIWAVDNKLEWALNPEVAAPSLKEIEKISVEDIGKNFTQPHNDAKIERLKFMIKESDNK